MAPRIYECPSLVRVLTIGVPLLIGMPLDGHPSGGLDNIGLAEHGPAAGVPLVDGVPYGHHQGAGDESPMPSVSATRGGRQYSLFMHHSSGWALVALSALVLADRLTKRRHRVIAASIGSVWILFGLFIFIWADPEGWPIGPAGLLESFSMATSGEWLQHKTLSFIPMLTGLAALYHRRGERIADKWNYALAFGAVVGVIGLLIHQHQDHPGMDVVNMQHRLFALIAVLVAVSFIQEGWKGWDWKGKDVILPACLLLLGLQLACYVE